MNNDKMFTDINDLLIEARNWRNKDVSNNKIDRAMEKLSQLKQVIYNSHPTGQVDFEKVVREWEASFSIKRRLNSPIDLVGELIINLKTAVPAESVKNET